MQLVFDTDLCWWWSHPNPAKAGVHSYCVRRLDQQVNTTIYQYYTLILTTTKKKNNNSDKCGHVIATISVYLNADNSVSSCFKDDEEGSPLGHTWPKLLTWQVFRRMMWQENSLETYPSPGWQLRNNQRKNKSMEICLAVYANRQVLMIWVCGAVSFYSVLFVFLHSVPH